MKKLIVILIIMLSSVLVFSEESFFNVPNSNAKINYKISSNWQLLDCKKKSKNSYLNVLIRPKSENNSSENTPSILIYVDDAGPGEVIDPVHYNTYSMTKLKEIDPMEIFSYSDDIIKIKSVIGSWGYAYNDNKQKKIMSNITFTFGTKGVRIILNCMEPDFKSLQNEFSDFIASIKLETNEKVPEITEIVDNNIVYLRYGNTGIVKKVKKR